MAPRRSDPPEEALARVVLERYLRLRRGEALTIEAWSHALRWGRAAVVEARRRGAVPTLIVEDEPAFFRSIAAVGARGVRRPGPPSRGAYLYFPGPEALPRLRGLPAPDRDRLLARHDRAWWQRARRAGVRALEVAVANATESTAELLGVDRGEWEADLRRAILVDPGRLERVGAGLGRRLGRARSLTVEHPNGSRLAAERAPRPAVVDVGRPDPASGRVWSRVPAGLLVLPLRPGSAEGVWETNRPTVDRFADPPVAVGARLRFDGGRLVEYAVDRGGEPIAAAIARLGRGRVRAMALTVGLNPRIGAAPELPELAEGTVGLWLSERPFRPDGPRPRFSFVAPLAGADVAVDGRPWLRAGRPAPARR